MKTLNIVLVGLMLSLLGCIETGNKSLKHATESKIKKQITIGITTKNQVQAIFGNPIKTRYTENNSLIWKYQFDNTTTLTPQTLVSIIFTWGLVGTKTIGTRKELVILFDKNDVVRKFNMSNRKINQGTNLFK